MPEINDTIPESMLCQGSSEVGCVHQITTDTLPTKVDGVELKLCTTCIDNTRICEDCDIRLWQDDVYYIQGGDYLVCNPCLDDSYFCCDNCSNYMNNDDRAFVEEDDEYINTCIHCYHGDDNSGIRDKQIDFNSAKTVYGTERYRGEIIKSPRTFGVEFEIVPDFKRVKHDKREKKFVYGDNFKCWGIHGDGSLSDGGIEVVTPPMRLKRGENDLRLFTKKTVEGGWTVDKSCGTHVHVDGAEFRNDDKLLRRLVLSYILLDEAIVRMIPKIRRENSYCSPLEPRTAILGKAHSSGKLGYTLGEFFEAKSIDELQNIIYKTKTREQLSESIGQHYNNTRYYGINFHPLFSGYGTVEVRYHQGTIDAEELLPWIALHQHILDNARKIDDKRALILKGIKNPIERFMAYAIETNMDKLVVDTMLNRIKKYK